jgi:hypothetical protein
VRNSAALAATATLWVLAAVLVAHSLGPQSLQPVRWDFEVSADPLPVAAVEDTFAKLDYDVSHVRLGHAVPRILVRTIPDDLGQVREVDRRKDLFLAAVLPLALAVNEQINAERSEISAMAKKIILGQDLTFLERDELDRLARVYRVIDEADDNDDELDKTTPELSASDLIDELLLRAAPLPVSLVLAQAAEKVTRFMASGCGTMGWGLFPNREQMGKPTASAPFATSTNQRCLTPII